MLLVKLHKAKESEFLKEKRQSNKSLVILHDTLRKKTHDLSLVEANHGFIVSVAVTDARRKERSNYASVIRAEKDQGLKAKHASLVSSDVLLILWS